MKTLPTVCTVLLITLLLSSAACSPKIAESAPGQPPPAQTQPPAAATPVPEAAFDPGLTTVMEMVDRLNAGDLEGSLAYFADDAMGYIVGLPPTGMEVYAGKEQIRALWTDSISNHFLWEIGDTQVDGNVIYVQAKTWHDFTRQLEVAPLSWNDVYEIQEGKIATYSTTITAESLSKLKPALAAVMPPEPTSAPSADPPVSEMMVTIAGGTCSTDSPQALQSGDIRVTVNAEDLQNTGYALTVFSLAEGKDMVDLMATTAGMPPEWAEMLLMEELEPGKSATYTFTAENRPVYMICWSQPPDLAIGNAGPFEVRP